MQDLRIFEIVKLIALISALLLSALTLKAQEYDVYLCMGQSNMAGRDSLSLNDNVTPEGVYLLDDKGDIVPFTAPANQYSSIRKRLDIQGISPALSFGKKIHETTSRPILLVVQARGGTSIDSWLPCAEAKEQPQFFSEAVRRTKQALAYGKLKGIIWHQGESDSDPDKAENYMRKLESMVSRLRMELNAENTPFIAGEIQQNHRNASIFNPVIQTISEHIPNSTYVSSKGCPVLSDNLHFTRDGQITLGERYAAAMLLLQEKSVEWTAEKHPKIKEIYGSPRLIETSLGMAVEFDGEDDGVLLDSVPIAGMGEFTMEMIFKPYGNAAFEQRFLHMGEYGGARIMFESRVNQDNTWYFDAFVHLGDKANSKALIDPAKTHPTDQWYNLTIVVGKDGIESYVNGVKECSDALPYRPVISKGASSVGVRQNKVCWFKGAIFKLKITPKRLLPEEFLNDYQTLNNITK